MLDYLPDKGVMFLGGHINMTKKLKSRYPKWLFISDEQSRKKFSSNISVIFYWTAHGSHKLMRNVYSKIPNGTKIIYVTATNTDLLEKEMFIKYQKTT